MGKVNQSIPHRNKRELRVTMKKISTALVT